MSFTDQQPFTVTAADLKRPWSGKTDGSRFRCYLCLEKFKEGDVARWQYNTGKGPNFFTCQKCDGEDVSARFEAIHLEFMKRYRAMGYDE